MIINESELFKGIDYEIMNEIVDICSEEQIGKNMVLFQQDQKADSLYILEEGTVDLVISNGGNITYKLTDPGEVFGWSSMVESGHYTASGICKTDVKVVKIDRHDLDKIFDLHPDIGVIILRRLGNIVAKRLSNAYRDLLSAMSTETTPVY